MGVDAAVIVAGVCGRVREFWRGGFEIIDATCTVLLKLDSKLFAAPPIHTKACFAHAAPEK
ncbi:MAG: hypothetical protein JWR68_1513 [Polaromonas sp.]|nr:hypothetical protein [Polaromonas sp.]